ncbi:MAG: dihydrodipicolinate reductase C-terminal domain-containing protein [Acidobacteriota bacterium]|nr:dihydrodipicolinate reductase [Blastocatellia bacterium]MDW8239230.1 dihydrodipicolinate reductase C-terminal domain-containing protein [Acidobacteriota bacterium]
MNIALLGYGRMGKLIEQRAISQAITVSLVLDATNNDQFQGVTPENLSGVDVAIDFSTPGAVVENIRRVAAAGVNMVVGTTGWYEHLDEVKQIVCTHGIGLVYGPNFSIGMNLFFKLIEQAGRLFHRFGGFDPFIEEAHHKFKKDAPSGTAVTLGRLLEAWYPGRSVPITSVRAGYIPGTHAVSFDSEVETIMLRHVARTREGFADGALLAARWIVGKKGFYEFSHIVEELQ